MHIHKSSHTRGLAGPSVPAEISTAGAYQCAHTHTHTEHTISHTHTVAACFSSGIVIVYLFPTLTQDSTHTVELSKLMWIYKYILYVSDIQ